MRTLVQRNPSRIPAMQNCCLRVYTPYMAMLSRPAWEALGAPPAVAIAVDERGYSIEAAIPGSEGAIRVHKNRQVSIGVIADAMRELTFPVSIELVREDGRLRFGEVSA